ncbi:MAG: M28 family metallopeptidase [Flavobacteriales bacterium]
MKKTVIAILFTAVFFPSGSCQELIKMAEKYIADLASTEMDGRGYVNDGMGKAAVYMAEAFKHAGLKPLDGNYYQSYRHDVNTFPDSMCVTADGKTLVAGKDFITQPFGGSSAGEFNVEEVNEKTIWKYYPKKQPALVFYKALRDIKNTDSLRKLNTLLYLLSLRQPVIQVTNQKLTWGVCSSASDTSAHAFILIHASALEKVPNKIYLNIKSVFVTGFSAKNVCAILPATKKSKKYIVFSAHYDHLGKMGSEAMFRGANDNAGGCAMLLCLAYELSKIKRDVNYIFIAFGSEEAGLIGSTYFVGHSPVKLKRIKFLLNLDLVATGEEGITVVNATEFPKAFTALEKINTSNDYFTQLKKRGPAANSDHYPFYKKGVPSFFIYTLGGSKAYHDIYDVPENLHLEGFSNLIKLLLTFCEELK